MELPQLAELERVQTGILNGISNIDLSLLSPNNDLSAASNDVMAPPKLGYPPFSDQTVSPTSSSLKLPDYYDRHIKSRLDNLSAASIHHRYKSVVLHAVGFNVEAVISYLFALNGGKMSKKKINLRLAPEETSAKLM